MEAFNCCGLQIEAQYCDKPRGNPLRKKTDLVPREDPICYSSGTSGLFDYELNPRTYRAGLVINSNQSVSPTMMAFKTSSQLTIVSGCSIGVRFARIVLAPKVSHRLNAYISPVVRRDIEMV